MSLYPLNETKTNAVLPTGNVLRYVRKHETVILAPKSVKIYLCTSGFQTPMLENFCESISKKIHRSLKSISESIAKSKNSRVHKSTPFLFGVYHNVLNTKYEAKYKGQNCEHRRRERRKIRLYKFTHE